LPIGIDSNARFDEEHIQLEPGDRLYFYSDGFTEAVNDRDEMLRLGGLIRLIEQAQSGSLDDSIVKCTEGLKRWCASVPLADDISLLALEFPAAN
jgi:sigma-B regulation protein RsbU (phosphoserine phosphatase)